MTLEPFAAPGFSVARPAGLQPKAVPEPERIVFEAPLPISRFEIRHVGRLRSSQVPPAEELVRKALAERKLTLVGEIERSRDYAAAVGDSGTDGPGRYVHLAYVRHWALGDENIPTFVSKDPPAFDLFTSEIAYDSPLTASLFQIRTTGG